MGTHHPYLDRPLELLVERWAVDHGLLITRTGPDGTEIKEPNTAAAITAILRESLQERGGKK
jgi:hypothetical protein